MSSSIGIKVPALALVALLGACGGGGGGGGGIDPADISTPEGAAMAALPALQFANIGSTAARSASSGSASSARGSLSGRWLPAGKVPVTAKGSGGGGGTVAADTEEPCFTSGSTVYYDTVEKDVNSPFSESLFAVDRYVDRDCTEVEVYEGGQSTFYSDGAYEEGCPVNDVECIVDYFKIGTSDARYRSNYEDESTLYGEYRSEYSVRGFGHNEYDSQTATDDSRIYLSFSSEETYIDNGEGGSGDSETFNLSGHFGTSSAPLRVVENQAGLSLTGSFGFESNDYPGCELGKASITTTSPLYEDPNTFNLVGEVEVSAGSRSALIQLNADGTADVTIDGNTETLTAEDIALFQELCPYFAAF